MAGTQQYSHFQNKRNPEVTWRLFGKSLSTAELDMPHLMPGYTAQLSLADITYFCRNHLKAKSKHHCIFLVFYMTACPQTRRADAWRSKESWNGPASQGELRTLLFPPTRFLLPVPYNRWCERESISFTRYFKKARCQRVQASETSDLKEGADFYDRDSEFASSVKENTIAW